MEEAAAMAVVSVLVKETIGLVRIAMLTEVSHFKDGDGLIVMAMD